MTTIRGGGGYRPPPEEGQPPTAAEAAQQVSRQVGQQGQVRSKPVGPQGPTGPGQGVEGEEPVKSTLSPTDAARLVSQSGLVGKLRRRRDLDGDDGGSGQPVLPYEDVESIEQALAEGGGGGQASKGPLALHQSLVRQWLTRLQQPGGRKPNLDAMVETLVGDIAQGGGSLDGTDFVLLQQLASSTEQQPPSTAMAQQSMVALFDIDMSQAPVGQQLAAVALAITGHQEALEPTGEGLAPGPFAQGVAQVVEEGQQAVENGETMQEGVHLQLNMHRTFVTRR